MVSMVEPGYRGIITPGWVRDRLWARAQRVPSLDLRFAANRSLRDAVTGRELVTFTRASNAGQINGAGAWETAGNDVPRFHHDPVTGQCLGLLVEEQRINLLLNSATLSTQSVTSAATAYTLSFYGTGTVTLSGTSTAGPLVGTASNQRVSLTFTPTAGTLTLTVSGSVTNANLEAGSFATSWIPTTGTSATRSADIPTITGTAFSGWFNQGQGSLYYRAALGGIGSQNYIAALDAGAGFANSHTAYCTSGTPRYDVFVSSVAQSQLTPAPATSVSAGTAFDFAYAYAANDFSASRSGGAVSTDAAGTPPSISRLVIGSNGTTFHANGPISRLVFWPQRLPDAALRALTA
jgi:hypothetical protein